MRSLFRSLCLAVTKPLENRLYQCRCDIMQTEVASGSTQAFCAITRQSSQSEGSACDAYKLEPRSKAGYTLRPEHLAASFYSVRHDGSNPLRRADYRWLRGC